MKNKDIQMLSDHDILLDVIDLNSAEDHIERGPGYNRFLNIYGRYSRNNEKYPTSLFQYKDRVLTITCSFAFAGFDLSVICGNNTEAIRIFNEGWRSINDNTVRIFEHYTQALAEIRKYSDLDEAAFRMCGWHLLRYAFKWILYDEDIICSTECLPYVFSLAEELFLKEYLADVIKEDDKGLGEQRGTGSNEKYEDIFQQYVNKKDAFKDACLKELIKQYLRDVGVWNTIDSFYFEYDSKYTTIKTIVIEEWKLIVRELKHRTLKDLKLGKPSLEPTKLLFSDDHINTLSEQFFRDAGILAVDGSAMSGPEKLEAMKHIISFAQQVDYIARIKYGFEEDYSGTICSSGSFKHYIGKITEMETESDGCFDGGGGNYTLVETGHYEYRYVSFSVVKDVSWDELRSDYIRSQRDHYKHYHKIYDYDDQHWQYYGDNEDDSTSVIVSGNLYLLDPFGMKGIFMYREGRDKDIEES